jgi:hypothetical protein
MGSHLVAGGCVAAGGGDHALDVEHISKWRIGRIRPCRAASCTAAAGGDDRAINLYGRGDARGRGRLGHRNGRRLGDRLHGVAAHVETESIV